MKHQVQLQLFSLSSRTPQATHLRRTPHRMQAIQYNTVMTSATTPAEVKPPANGSNIMEATPDDILALLSIYRSCSEWRREEKIDVDGSDQKLKTQSSISKWEHVITAIPQQRKRCNHEILATITALEAYHRENSSKHAAHDITTNIFLDASCIQQLESRAMELREAIETYSNSIPTFCRILSEFWGLDMVCADGSSNQSIRSNIGHLLANQLINQLTWDAGLLTTILKYFNEGLYSDGGQKNGLESMRVYANAFSAMLQIEKSFWKLTETHSLDDLNIEATNSSLHLNTNGSCIELNQSLRAEARVECIIDGEITQVNLHDRMVSTDTIEDAIDIFLTNQKVKSNPSHRYCTFVTSVLLIGEEGCGKTFLLDSIKKRINKTDTNSQPVKVIRPSHQDFAGNTVGSSEDCWTALFSHAESEIMSGRRVLILIDDIDSLLSLNEMSTSFTCIQVGRRCKSLFLSILDAFAESVRPISGHLMIVCTARSRCDEIAGRFHRILAMDQMDALQRRKMIVSCLSTGVVSREHELPFSDDNTKEALDLVVSHATGKTTYELSQCCRDAVLSEALSKKNRNKTYNTLEERIRILDKMMQTKVPQSLRSGSLDGVVDIIVLTPEELVSRLTTNEFGNATLPLLGADAKQAYESLMNVVITPLCHSEKLTSLLHGCSDADEGSRHFPLAKSIRVGALLAGGPGVGKTSLAYHCASVAAEKSRVTLLDVSCTSLIHKEVGGSERAVHRLFEAVRAAAPCILLLDGIENVAPRRGNDCTTEGTMDRVLSTFLTEMDGIGDDEGRSSGNVGVIGITYNPELIDPSLLRPGRLEKTVTLGNPDFEERKELISRSIDGLEFDFSSAGYFDPKSKEDVSQNIAMLTTGMSASETIAICKEASMVCLRELNFDIDSSRQLSLRYDHFKVALKMLKG